MCIYYYKLFPNNLYKYCWFHYLYLIITTLHSFTGSNAFSQGWKTLISRNKERRSNREMGSEAPILYMISVLMCPRRSSLWDYELLSLQQEKADAGNDDIWEIEETLFIAISTAARYSYLPSFLYCVTLLFFL